MAEWLLLANDKGNNVTAFGVAETASGARSVSQIGLPSMIGGGALPTESLGEIHFANGKAFIAINGGLVGPAPALLASGGLAVIDVDTLQVESVLKLVSTQTGRQSRPVHVYVDPESKFLWVNNDGPSGDSNADSVFRVDVDPASAGYLTYTEIVVGDGHKKSAISRPHLAMNAKKLFITSSLSERRVDVIDDDPASATYGQVIKIVRNIGSSPHGMDYSPNSGWAFAGITGGGMVGVSADPAKLDADSNGVIDIPDFDCAATVDCSGDPSVVKLTAGDANNPTLFAGYIHTVVNDEHNEDVVYTSGFNSATDTGFLSAIDPETFAVETVLLPGVSSSSFDTVGHHKMYVPARQNGSVKNKIMVVDIDHDSPTHHQLLGTGIVVGDGGSHRNGEVSPDGDLAAYPDTCGTCSAVNVIDTATNAVVGTVNLSAVPANVGMIYLPFDAEDNH
ncbi:MAG: hypothetical protein ACOYXU_01625 [Nitrospirota bacterium]